MPISPPSIGHAPGSNPLFGWEVVVREGLSGRRKASTPAEERRLAKTLERLHPAASVALAGAVSANAQTPSPSFSSVLMQLSDA